MHNFHTRTLHCLCVACTLRAIDRVGSDRRGSGSEVAACSRARDHRGPGDSARPGEDCVVACRPLQPGARALASTAPRADVVRRSLQCHLLKARRNNARSCNPNTQHRTATLQYIYICSVKDHAWRVGDTPRCTCPHVQEHRWSPVGAQLHTPCLPATMLCAALSHLARCQIAGRREEASVWAGYLSRASCRRKPHGARDP